ncbi:putative Na(+)/H(+) antiporter nhx-3 [Toxocara canis]|uniref:Putative Na(+)/H(+) antiporter nhx-3 n=1 Tax=Toxocara canis TaxID=6265 RepID=A0A0B2VTN0_TOXCA|nr:putative Na(+)/H(+) antiporter nhx-3 [Toxocara canis]
MVEWMHLEFEWHDVNTPLIISLWLFCIILAKLDLFFLYLLPPIALEAGYFLPNRPFFRNIGTITLYAVVGTLWNIVSIGVVLYVFSPYYSMSVPFVDLLVFATLISAVDPVAVLSVFEEINVNKLLHICVFGESLLNDAVTIVLYHAFGAMARIGPEQLETEDFIKASISFFLVAFGGITIGMVWAAITGLTTSCEAIIFVFLGLSTVSKKHNWDIIFIAVTLAACLLCRFLGTYVLTYLANRKRVEKIRLVDQFIMAYGGLRGAICYGLAMTLDKDAVLAKEMFVSTTVVVIVFTVFIQGTTIKPLVRLLDVKTEEIRESTVAEQLLSDAQDDILAGIEAIIGIQGPNMMRRRVSLFNSNYVQPCMMRIPANRGQRLIAKILSKNGSEMGSRMTIDNNV